MAQRQHIHTHTHTHTQRRIKQEYTFSRNTILWYYKWCTSSSLVEPAPVPVTLTPDLSLVSVRDECPPAPAITADPGEVSRHVGPVDGPHQLAHLLVRPEHYDA